MESGVAAMALTTAKSCGGPSPISLTGMTVLSIFLRPAGRKKEFVGWIASICSCRCAGSDHSGARITRSPSSCSKMEYSVSRSFSTALTGKESLIQSLALLYDSCAGSMPLSDSHSWTWSNVSPEGLIRSLTSSEVRCWP